MIAVDAGMAETKQGTPPVRARIGNTGEGGRRHPATCLSHQPRGEELPINHLGEATTAEGRTHAGSYPSKWRAITMRCTSFVPSPISRTF